MIAKNAAVEIAHHLSFHAISACNMRLPV